MEKRIISDSEQRLLILYALKQLGPVTDTQLLQFMVEKDLMNYFDLQLNLLDLLEQDQVRRRSHPLGEMLVLREAGEYALQIFDHKIPWSRKEQIRQDIDQWIHRFRGEQQTLAETFPLQGGGCCIRLRLLEGKTAIMDLLLSVNENAPAHLSKRWRASAPVVYDRLMTLLSEGFPGEELPPELPDDCSLQVITEHEWLLSLRNQEQSMETLLMMTLPDESLGRYMAARWHSREEAIRDFVKNTLYTELT